MSKDERRAAAHDSTRQEGDGAGTGVTDAPGSGASGPQPTVTAGERTVEVDLESVDLRRTSGVRSAEEMAATVEVQTPPPEASRPTPRAGFSQGPRSDRPAVGPLPSGPPASTNAGNDGEHDGRGRRHSKGHVVAGTYEIVRTIGQGGMGTVYEAEHLRLRKRVALKILHGRSGDRETYARFLVEAQAAGQLGHPGIVTLFDQGTDGDDPFIAMELLDGEPLSVRLKRDKRLEPAFVVRFAIQVLGALDVAHARGIVHRDIKPENVFLARGEGDDPERPKILDFGVSKVADLEERGLRLTRTGAAVGTPLYMSPEQAAGDRDVDARTDIYSLGVMMFECLAGRPPRMASSYGRLLSDILNHPAPKLRAVAPDVSDDLANVVDRALEQRREDRFETARVMRAALAMLAADELRLDPDRKPPLVVVPKPEEAVTSLSPASRTTQRSGAAQVAERSRPWVLVVLGALLLAAALIVGFASGGTTTTTAPGPTASTPPRPPPELAPTTVALELRATPSTATIVVDGQPVSNPARIERPRDPSRAVVVRVQAPGFLAQEQRLSLDADSHVSIGLVPERPAATAADAGAAEPVARDPRGRPTGRRPVVPIKTRIE